MKFSVIKKDGAWHPVTPSDIEKSNKYPDGLQDVIDITGKRNVKLFRKAWAIARIILDNDREGKFQNEHHVIDSLLIITGYYTQMWNFDGSTYPKPDSISWERCSDDKFKEIWEKWLPYIMQYLDCTEEQINNNIIFYM